jgi:cytochrome c-type biogenesis protein CcmH/NrfF
MLFLGWAGNSYKKETEATLKPGQALSIAGFSVRFDRLRRGEDLQKETLDAEVTILDRGKRVALAHMPGREIYKKSSDENNITIPSIKRMAVGDLYLTLAGFDLNEGAANIKVVWNPLVSWYWLGFMMLAFGTVICLAPDRSYAYAAARRGVAAAVTVSAFLLALLGAARAVHAQMPMAEHQVTGELSQRPPATAAEKSIFRKIGCSCPTCNHDPLLDCACGSADKMRERIRGMMAQGMTEDQIIAAHIAEYGSAILTVPRTKVVWAVPIGGGLGGLGVVALLAWRWTRRAPSAPTAPSAPAPVPKPAATATHDPYEERLEDELRDLD